MTRKKYQMLRRAYRSIIKYDDDYYDTEMSPEVRTMADFRDWRADRLHLKGLGLYLPAATEVLRWIQDRGYPISGPKEKLP